MIFSFLAGRKHVLLGGDIVIFKRGPTRDVSQAIYRRPLAVSTSLGVECFASKRRGLSPHKAEQKMTSLAMGGKSKYS